MKVIPFLFLTFGWIAGAHAADEQATVPVTSTPIMMDGKCDDQPWKQVSMTDIGSGVSLAMLQDELYFYLCISLPENSYGPMDMYAVDPADGKRVNFHVSAQRGERKVRADGTWPGFEWENQSGWYANVVVMKYARETGLVCCHVSSAREMQFAKDMIADEKGRVTFMLDIRSLAQASGEMRGTTVYPEAAAKEDPENWKTVNLKVD